jgi:N-acetylmuramoyl-L-alanine amidase|tara:strand:- start:951 stop:1337 length:387 start_codon:yes stop_codon:yes gene_type:complete
MVEGLFCLALAVYFEARGEPAAGQLAVAHVIQNRVRSGRYPDSFCEVVTEARSVGLHRCQFSFYCDGKREAILDDVAWLASRVIAEASLHVNDITEGATHYHSTSVDPAWASSMTVTIKIGNHIFYSD